MSERFSPRRPQKDKPRRPRSEVVDWDSKTPEYDANINVFDAFLADDELRKQIELAESSDDRAVARDNGELVFPGMPVGEVQEDLPSAHAVPARTDLRTNAMNIHRRINKSRLSKEATSTLSLQNSESDSEGMTGVVSAPGFSTDTDWTADIDNKTTSDSDTVSGAQDKDDIAYEAPVEGATMGASQYDSETDASETMSSSEQDVVTGSVVDDSEPQKASKPKHKKAKAKKAKGSQEPEPTLADYNYVATYTDDQFFGPEEEPFRKFVRTSETYNDARVAYDEADKELAGKVARRLKLGMFASKKTREAASAEVEAARPEYERMAEVFDAVQIEKWKLKDPTISDEEINHKLANYHEAKLRLQGLRAQHEILTAPGKFGKLSELNNKATEWFAGLSRKQKIAVGIGSVVVGAGAGLFVAAAGTVLGSGAGLVGASLVTGAKLLKTKTQGQAGLHRNTAEVDKADFKDADGSYKSIDELRVQSSVSFKKGFDQRVEKADKINNKAKWMTIASAALLGAGIAGHIDAVHDAYKAAEGGIADYFGITDHHDVLPSGGSGARNPADLGSGDVNPHNQYTFTHHDVAPAPAPAPATPVEVVPQDMDGATEFSGAGLDHFNQWANGHTVQPGESVWKLSQDYLQANGVRNPSVYQIDAVKDKVLAEFSTKGLVDAKGWLTAGQQLRIK